jgi:hypothetical protein
MALIALVDLAYLAALLASDPAAVPAPAAVKVTPRKPRRGEPGAQVADCGFVRCP